MEAQFQLTGSLFGALNMNEGSTFLSALFKTLNVFVSEEQPPSPRAQSQNGLKAQTIKQASFSEGLLRYQSISINLMHVACTICH